MFKLIDELEGYFDIINDEDFILGIDKTGVYAFTDDVDVDVVLVKYSRMLKTLALKRSESVLCIVTDEEIQQNLPILNVVRPQELERWVRKTAGARKTVFQENDIKSIFDCYFESEDDEDSMYDILREFNLPEPVVISLVNDPPATVHDITRFGVDKQTAYEVLNTFQQSFDYFRDTDSSVERGVSVTLYSFIRRNVIISISLAICASICIIINFGWVGAIFSLLGIVYGRKAEKVNDDATAKFIKWSNIFLLILALYPVIKYAIEYSIIWLVQKGYIGD